MDAGLWLETVLASFCRAKQLAERACEQVGDEDFFRAPAEGANSLAIQFKHVGGNLRSRWTDILTTDGEKPDRHRDQEFEDQGLARAAVFEIWEAGWRVCKDSLGALTPDDLERTITIRSEPIGVVDAIHRSLSHADYHTGQIVQVARQWCGAEWKTLSIARGESAEAEAAVRARFGG